MMKRASADGARFARVRDYGGVSKEALAERTLATFDEIPWPLRFTMYWDAFRRAYREERAMVLKRRAAR